MAEQIDTTSLLWDYYFMVRIPRNTSRSKQEIKMYGTYSSGNKEVDKALMDDWLTTSLSIAMMMKYWKEGQPIRVVKEADTKTIYEYISRHLEVWKLHLQRSVNKLNVPIEDLIALDEFAAVVYPHAARHFTKDTAHSMFANAMDQVGFSPMNFFVNQPDPDEVQIIETKPDEHESMGDLLKSHLMKIQRR